MVQLNFHFLSSPHSFLPVKQLHLFQTFRRRNPIFFMKLGHFINFGFRHFGRHRCRYSCGCYRRRWCGHRRVSRYFCHRLIINFCTYGICLSISIRIHRIQTSCLYLIFPHTATCICLIHYFCICCICPVLRPGRLFLPAFSFPFRRFFPSCIPCFSISIPASTVPTARCPALRHTSCLSLIPV